MIRGSLYLKKKKKKLASELHLSIKVLENESLQASARPYVTYLVQCKSLIGGLKSFKKKNLLTVSLFLV